MFWCKLRIEPRSNFAGRLNILCQEVHFVKKGTGCILWTISIGYGTTDDTMYYMQAAVLRCGGSVRPMRDGTVKICCCAPEGL